MSSTSPLSTSGCHRRAGFSSAFVLTWILFSGWATSAHAATFTVTSGADSGPGTLRQAIFDANVNADASNTITLATNVTLTRSLPMITKSATIAGGGFTVDAANTGRVFFVQAGTVNISNVTIANARAQGGAGGGNVGIPGVGGTTVFQGVGGGGGGGLGAGAAVFVHTGAAVTLSNVSTIDASAAGGTGGNGGPGGGSGGSGGGGGLNGSGGGFPPHNASGGGGGYAGHGGNGASSGGGGGGGEFGMGGPGGGTLGGGGGGGQQGNGGTSANDNFSGGGGGGATADGQSALAGGAGGGAEGGAGGGAVDRATLATLPQPRWAVVAVAAGALVETVPSQAAVGEPMRQVVGRVALVVAVVAAGVAIAASPADRASLSAVVAEPVRE